MSVIVLFAHGSRDPNWATPLRALRASVADQSPDPVVLSFLEWQPPSLEDTLNDLATTGHQTIVVVPVFFGRGHHIREDLDLIIRGAQKMYPSVVFQVTGTLGEEPTIIAALADGIHRCVQSLKTC